MKCVLDYYNIIFIYIQYFFFLQLYYTFIQCDNYYLYVKFISFILIMLFKIIVLTIEIKTLNKLCKSINQIKFDQFKDIEWKVLKD